jgi:hypothetical protein
MKEQHPIEAGDPAPAPGWSVDWEIEDRYRLLPRGKQVRLRYTGLTTEAQVGMAESWVSLWSFADTEEAWIPRLMVRRRRAPLASTFVGVLEPY